MERAPLRPVPRRPSGPIDPADAGRAVAAALPALDPEAREALALITLAGRTRTEAAARMGLAAGDLAKAVARARKALRRSAQPLPASGWCERAELLISDRLDGELEDTGARRLEVHLRNCERCVEHERHLVQATDALVEGVAGAPLAEVVPAPAPAPLRLAGPVGRGAARQTAGEPIAVLPFGEPVSLTGSRQPEPDSRLAARELAAAATRQALIAAAVLLAVLATVIALLATLH